MIDFGGIFERPWRINRLDRIIEMPRLEMAAWQAQRTAEQQRKAHAFHEEIISLLDDDLSDAYRFGSLTTDQIMLLQMLRDRRK